MKPNVVPVFDSLMVSALDAALDPGGVAALDPAVPARVWQRALVEPAASFLARPGKELRARMVRAGWALAGGGPQVPANLAIAVEALHAGSLIIDDVEDGSDHRRGAPTLHRLVGVPLAINTGSWMYFWAIGELPPEAQRAAITTMIRCHQGQALDLSVRIPDLDAAEVPAVVAATTRLKTGALCRFAMELGAIAAGAPSEAIADLGERAGVALQMLDDLGGIVAPARRAKGLEDLRDGRPTWPWAWLAETADPFLWARARARVDDPEGLRTLLCDSIGEIGRARVRAHLDQTIDALDGPGHVIDELAAMLRGMEAAYA